MKHSSALFLPLWLIAASGCSAAPHPAAAPTGARPHATIEDAESDLARAESQLPPASAVGGTLQPSPPSQYAQPPKDKAEAAQPPPVSEAPAKPASKPAAEQQRAEAEKKPHERPQADADEAPTPCQTACRAFASMQRAAESVCRLAGDADTRCEGAKKRVENARARVLHCGCQ